jgi:outer membrane cobalamin receptor
MKQVMIRISLMLVVVVSSVALYAAGEVVVTATRTPREAMDVSASVTVVGRESIESSGARNLDDALRHVQGVSTLQAVGMGYGVPSQINLRGVPGINSVLLLVDGFTVNDPGTGFVNMNAVPMSAIDQVEVVRGGFSALYGADAFGGVINMLTRSPSDMSSLESIVRFGNDGFQQATVQGGMGDDSLGYVIVVDAREIDNYLAHDHIVESRWDAAQQVYVETVKEAKNLDYEEGRALLKFVMDVGQDSHLVILGRWFSSELGNGQTDIRPWYPTVEDNILISDTVSVGAELTSQLFADLATRCRISYRNNARTQKGVDLSHVENNIPVYARSISETDSDEWYIELGGDLEYGQSQIISAGVDFRRDDSEFHAMKNEATGVRLPVSQGTHEPINNAGFYVQDEVDASDDVVAVVGLRVDAHSEFDEAISPKLGARWKIKDDLVLRASVAKAYRAPTSLEMFQPPIAFGPIIFTGNENLEPEFITSSDIGLEARVSDSLSVQLDVFYNDMEDLIGKQVEASNITFVNIDSAWSAGLEAGVSFDVSDAISTYVNYTHQKTENKRTGNDLEHIPDNMFNVGVNGSWALNNACMFDASVSEKYHGDQGYLDTANGSWQTLDSYWRTDLSAKVTLRKKTWVGLSVLNAFNEIYQEWPLVNPAPGRFVTLEVGARL